MNILLLVTVALVSAILASILTSRQHFNYESQESRQEWIAWTLLALYDWKQPLSKRKDFSDDEHELSWSWRPSQGTVPAKLAFAGIYLLSRAVLGPIFEYVSWLVSKIDKFDRT